MKVEDRSQEETERQERCARGKTWNLVKIFTSSKKKDKTAIRISKNWTTVLTANGEVQTREEATVYVKELDSSVKVVLLEERPAVLSLGKLCEDYVYTYHWKSGQKPHLTKDGRRITCNVANYVPFVVPGLSTSSSASSSPDSSTPPSKDSLVGSQFPATEGSEILSEESRRNPSRVSVETENTK